MRLSLDRRLCFVVCCAALTVVYLCWWVTYTSTRQNDDHFKVLAAGAAFESPDGTARVLTLRQTGQILDSEGGKPDLPTADSVFVVATVEIVRHRPSERTWCEVELVSTQRRVWAEDGPAVSRQLPDCDDQDLHDDQPYRYEAVFTVPTADADSIAGVGLRDTSGAHRTPILRPAG